MKNRKRPDIIIGVILLVLAAAALAWHFFGPQNDVQAGSKEICVTVVHGNGSTKDLKFRTDAEFLGTALDEQKLIEGDEGEYGIFITAVDGETADASKEQWWNITKGGEMLMTGVSMTPIADGDCFELTLTVGYDVF